MKLIRQFLNLIPLRRNKKLSEQAFHHSDIFAQIVAFEAEKKRVRALQEQQAASTAPRLSATDLARMAICPRKLYLKFYGDPAEKVLVPPLQQILQQQGVLHEVTTIDPRAFTKIEVENLEDSAQKTLEAMQKGVGKIYQGVLRSDELQGKPDLLIRVEEPSALGEYSYYPLEIKSGYQLKNEHKLQMMAYLHLLHQIQGRSPVGIIQLGDHSQHKIKLEPEFEQWLFRARVIASGYREPSPFIASYCNRCEWRQHCHQLADQGEDLSLLPGIKRQLRTALHQEGIMTLSHLAKIEPNKLLHIKGIGSKTAQTMVYRSKAFLANEAIAFGKPILPQSDLEIYFDVESVGFRQDSIRYYLFGWGIRQGQSPTFEYEYELAEDPEQEAEIWQRFLDRIGYVVGPVFHYSNYEKRTIKTLCQRYGLDPRAEHLQSQLVDLYPLITNNIALPLESYSIKRVAPWLGYNWTGPTQTAAATMIEYSYWLRTGDRTHLSNILTYNEHDCRAMVTIKDWLAGFEL